MPEQSPQPTPQLGVDEWGVTPVTGVLGRVEPFENRPHAAKLLHADTAHVVVFSFAAGQLLKEHAAHHSALITCLTGSVLFGWGETGSESEVVLKTGDFIHLPPRRRHRVEALSDATITVTMLVTDGA